MTNSVIEMQEHAGDLNSRKKVIVSSSYRLGSPGV